MEFIKEGSDTKDIPQKTADDTERFMIAWRNSEFYDFVMRVLDNEIDTNLLKEAMEKAYLEGTPMTDEEISSMARTEAMSAIRIKNIRETLR